MSAALFDRPSVSRFALHFSVVVYNLLALRPAALVMLCGQEAGRFNKGDRVAVTVTSIDRLHGKVKIELAS